MIDFQHSPAKSLNQALLDCDTFIEGMQRAQDKFFSTATTTNFLNVKANDLIEKNSMARLDIVSIEKCNTKEVNPGSFMLFGKMIHLHPVESNLHDSATKGEDGCMGCNN